jgi:hypothetical protein
LRVFDGARGLGLGLRLGSELHLCELDQRSCQLLKIRGRAVNRANP